MNKKCNTIVLLAIFISTVFSGCGKDSTTAPDREADITIVSDRTIVITGEEGISLIGIEGSAYTFNVQGTVPEISEHDIIVGTEQGGYIREVISTDLIERKLVIETKFASLADAVIVGRADTTIHMGMGSPMMYSRPPRESCPMNLAYTAPGIALTEVRLNLSNVILYDGDVGGVDLGVTLTNGSIEFNPNFDWGMKIRIGTMKEFSTSIHGQLNIDCNISVDATGAINHSNEVLLATFSQPVVQSIGHVPIIEVVELSFSAGYELTSEFAGNLHVGYGSTGNVTLGARYVDNGWMSIDTTDTEFLSHYFYYDSYANATLRVYIKPCLNVTVYSIEGAHIEFEPHLGFNAEVNTLPVVEWEISGGISRELALPLKMLDRRLPVYSDVPLDLRAVLDSGPFKTDSYVFVTKWGTEGSGDGQFAFPKGITVDPESDIYVADNLNHRVQKFVSDGTFITAWGSLGSEDGLFNSPTDIAADTEGNVYVIDNGNHRIQKFSSDGTFIIKWGSEGTGDDQFRNPEGIAVDGDGNVYVVDSVNNRVQKFTSNGSFITKWGSFGSGDGQFDSPVGIAADTNGNVYVSECRNNRIQKFNAVGDFIQKWGSLGSNDGQFDCPVDVTTDADGNVYVVDYGNDRIEKFTANGAFTTTLGSRGTGDGQFDRPEGIAVDSEGNIYIVDSRNWRIQKFAPINQ